jgi:hypothetical protein
METKPLFSLRIQEFQSRAGVSKEQTTTFFGIPNRNPAGAMGPFESAFFPDNHRKAEKIASTNLEMNQNVFG